jgi:gamma-glutamylcyclotransferase (GGCT)/AIG2-like uncharacterized protein YtfP
MHLFTYGTLMFPAVWGLVLGRTFPTQAARVTGYAVYQARGEVFPVMVAAGDDDLVAGLAYLNVDDSAIVALDAFESDLYDRVAVSAALADGRQLACQAYVLPKRNRRLAASTGWDAARFEREALDEYLRRLSQ